MIESLEINDCAEFDTEKEAQDFYSGSKRLIRRKGKDYDVIIRKKRMRVWKVERAD